MKETRLMILRTKNNQKLIIHFVLFRFISVFGKIYWFFVYYCLRRVMFAIHKWQFELVERLSGDFLLNVSNEIFDISSLAHSNQHKNNNSFVIANSKLKKKNQKESHKNSNFSANVHKNKKSRIHWNTSLKVE